MKKSTSRDVNNGEVLTMGQTRDLGGEQKEEDESYLCGKLGSDLNATTAAGLTYF